MWFESYVILDTTKTLPKIFPKNLKFESYVILDTTKTQYQTHAKDDKFESYVILDTTKTPNDQAQLVRGLRVMLF